jgi:hypothetical protein
LSASGRPGGRGLSGGSPGVAAPRNRGASRVGPDRAGTHASLVRRFRVRVERVVLGAAMSVAAWAAERWVLRAIERRSR